MPFDYDAHTTGMLNRYLDSLDDPCGECDNCDCIGCDGCDMDNEPDPDRFRDEDPNELDREDY